MTALVAARYANVLPEATRPAEAVERAGPLSSSPGNRFSAVLHMGVLQRRAMAGTLVMSGYCMRHRLVMW